MGKELRKNKIIILIVISLLFSPFIFSGKDNVNQMNQFSDFGFPSKDYTPDDAGGPPAPTLTSPSNGAVMNDNTPTLDWETVVNTLVYEIQVDDSATFTSPVIDDSEHIDSEYTCTSLSDNTYYWRVRVLDEFFVYGDWSSVWSFQIDTVAPGTPSLNLPASGTLTNDNTTTYSWNSVSTATLYQIQIDDSSGFGSPAISTTTSNTHYTSPALADNTYYWHVRARDAAGNWGSYSSYWSLEIDTTAPEAPTLISPDQGSWFQNRNPILIWESVSNGTDYWVQVSSNEIFTSLVVNVTVGDITNYTCPTLSDHWFYSWRVKAKDAFNWGSWSSRWVFTVSNTPPPAPTLVTPEHESITTDPTPYFECMQFIPIHNYQIQIDTSESFSTPVINDSAPYGTYVSALLDDNIYYWRMRAINFAGNIGPWSAVWSFEVDTTPPSISTLVSPTNGIVISNSTPTLYWANDMAWDNQIQLDNDQAFTSPLINRNFLLCNYPIATFGPALADGTYFWRARSCDMSYNWANWSDTGNFTVDTTNPTISDIVINPTSPDDNDEVKIQCNVTDANDLNILLYYRINGGNWNTQTMSSTTGDTYEANLGVFTYDDFIEFYVNASDCAVEPNFTIDNNGGSYYTATIISSDTTGPTISVTTFGPISPDHTDTITVNCSVYDMNDVLSVIIYYRIDGGSWLPVGMIFKAGTEYTAFFGPFSSGDYVEFYIEAYDNSIIQNSAIDDNSGNYYSFTVLISTDITPIIIYIPLIAAFTALLFLRKKK
ncbi:MAG: hypothetical protein ACTSXA_10225 [Candidatus Heimdallarchaeota archaeon]